MGYFKWDSGNKSDPTALHTDVNGEINGLTEKAVLANDDLLVIEDSAASNAKKKVKRSSIVAGVTDGNAIHGTTGGEIISLTEKAVLADGDLLLIEDSAASYAKKKVQKSALNTPQWTWLSTPLTSTDWDGDARSTTSKTLIDLSAVFGVPAGVKAVFARVWIRDSGSAGASNAWFLLSPNDTAYQGSFAVFCQGLANDSYSGGSAICPCDANGDIYYQLAASGTGTMDVSIEIWGYYK